MANINRVILVGNLTRDPELRTTQGGLTVCSLRLAVNNRRKNGQTGEWVDEPNYFDVTVFGGQGESAARFLSKGRQVAVDGRLRWREWEAQDGSGKRQAVDVIAESVQFIGPRDGGGEGGGYGGGSGGYAHREPTPVPASPAASPDPWGGSGGADDDIPF